MRSVSPCLNYKDRSPCQISQGALASSARLAVARQLRSYLVFVVEIGTWRFALHEAPREGAWRIRSEPGHDLAITRSVL